MKNKLEILFWTFAIYLIKKGYGAECEQSDIDDPMYKKGKLSENIRNSGRCSSCRAKEAIDWIEDHISLIKWSCQKE